MMRWRGRPGGTESGADGGVDQQPSSIEQESAVAAAAEACLRQSKDLAASAKEAHENGDTRKAVELQGEALAAARFHAAVERGGGDVHLAKTLIPLARYCAATGEKDDAVALRREAVRLLRPAVQGPHSKQKNRYVWNLLMLAELLDVSDDLGEVVGLAREALRLVEVRLSSRNMIKSLADVIVDVSTELCERRRLAEAIEFRRAHVALLEDFDERHPGTQLSVLAGVWSIIAHMSARLNDFDAAIDAAERSCAVLHRAGVRVPARHEALVAGHLLSMANRLYHADRSDVCERWTTTAVGIFEGLHAREPHEYLSGRIRSLNLAAYVSRTSGPERAAEGLASAQEALVLLDSVAEDESAALVPVRGEVLDTVADLLCVLNRFDEALPLAREAVALTRTPRPATDRGEAVYPARELTERLLARIEDRVGPDAAA